MFGNQFFSSTSSDDEYNKLLDDVFGADYTAFYRGTVVDNDDPLHFGRVRVRVPQIYGSSEQRDTKLYTPNIAIPWATSAIMAGAGNNTGAYLIPNVGDTVLVTFENGDPQLPLYFGGLLTADGENKFIGTKDANNDEYYKVTSEDFNTDITNKSQRVLYKSLKGATIIIDDKDGSESIKIIDQLGQFISLENFSGEALNRDRSGGVDTKARSGRIVIKDAYEDSIALNNGEIHIKAPKITIETDNFYQVGLNNEFPDEVDLADDILGSDEEPIPPTPERPELYFYNDIDKDVVFGINYDFDDEEDFNYKTSFDHKLVLSPGDSSTFPIPEGGTRSGFYKVTCLDSNYYGNYNITNEWQGNYQQSLNASSCLFNGTQYVRALIEIDGLTTEEKEEIMSSGKLLVVSNDTDYRLEINCTTTGYAGNPGFTIGYNTLLHTIIPDTQHNREYELKRLLLPVGYYEFTLTSSSGNLDHTLGTVVAGPTVDLNSNPFYRFPFYPKGTYYLGVYPNIDITEELSIDSMYFGFFIEDDHIGFHLSNGDDTITCITANLSDSDYDGSSWLAPHSKAIVGTYSEGLLIGAGETLNRYDLISTDNIDLEKQYTLCFGYFVVDRG